MKRLTLILISLFTLNSWAAKDLTKDMDALGANRELMKKAKSIDPKNRIRVVQNREVDRYMRLEIGVNYGMNSGGDPYIDTTIMGGQFDFHVTPRWSIGARYYNASNTLNKEGEAVFKDAEQRRKSDPDYRIPATDYAKDSWLIVGNWYPIYGKMNLFDATVSQFDIYVLGGYGQVNLASGSAPTYTAGGGVGLWLTQHVASRLEARWQGYQDKVYTGSRDINQTVLTATVSFLL